MWSAPSVDMLARALGSRALLEIVEHDGVLHGVTAVDGRLRLHRLAAVRDVRGELEQVRFTLRRLALPASTASNDAACHALEFGLKRIDSLLFAPVAAEVADRELLVVPTGALHAVPWAALPSVGWRPVTVAPSAAVWHRAATAADAPDGDRRIVLVAGPNLPNASREVAALARRHPGARQFAGARANSDAVLAALDGAELAHVACHGRFRSDNPLFSSLELTDGPVTVYDLEGLARAPRTLVLSACDSGLSEVCVGDELMGLTASLLALGTRSVVAATCPVPDDATRRLMLRLHTGLAAGLRPAAALAAAQRQAATRSPGDLVTAVGFVCFGAG
jgi:CHAT domain-containing protein